MYFDSKRTLNENLIRMEIKKKINLTNGPKDTFRKFVGELNNWWPREYTWSQEVLQEIKIDLRKDGLCTEIGPKGFRCDWGRVIALKENESIGMAWQISPRREPVPNLEKASEVHLKFRQEGAGTSLLLEHTQFQRHGAEGEKYREMMDSPQGWEYILDCFKKYCESGS